jgi:hypothetical protein
MVSFKARQEGMNMNIQNILLACGLIIVALIMALLTGGLLLPMSLPMFFKGLQKLGVMST